VEHREEVIRCRIEPSPARLMRRTGSLPQALAVARFSLFKPTSLPLHVRAAINDQ